MKEIYESAKKIIIWLGPAADNGDIAMDMIKHFARNGREQSLGSSDPVDPEFFGPPDMPFTDASWKALRKLLHQKWCSRTWIIQEASASGADSSPAAV